MQETNQQTGALTGTPAERLIDPQSTATPTPRLPELAVRQTLDTSYIPTKAGPAEDDILGIYVKEAKQFPLLTREEEVHLAKTYQAGRLAQARLSDDNQVLTDSQRLSLEQQFEAGQTAKEAFIRSNLRLVISLAKKYKGHGLSLPDLIQEGNLGMMHAVDKFDPDMGFKFSTYATNWIRQSISRALEHKGQTICIPSQKHHDLKRLSDKAMRLSADLGRPPTQDELTKALGWSVGKLVKINKIAQIRDLRSLDEQVGSGGKNAELGSLVADPKSGVDYEEATQHVDLSKFLEFALATLNDRERLIVGLRFGLDGSDPLTQVEIGKITGLSKDQIRMSEIKALKKLRSPSSNLGTNLADYIPNMTLASDLAS